MRNAVSFCYGYFLYRESERREKALIMCAVLKDSGCEALREGKGREGRGKTGKGRVKSGDKECYSQAFTCSYSPGIWHPQLGSATVPQSSPISHLPPQGIKIQSK